ncbi:hypothetical protein V3C41_01780 [Paenarthrobacter nicotinovorans]|uniref:Uncharacterized protein n=1 Tax=Paenarthrobacter nicotinovorans TaxID=29320 RepID=A0ABV0GMS5_PAENI
MEVNNREWALAIWLGLLILIVLLVPASRRSVPDIFRAFSNHRILVPFVLLVVYTGGVIAVLMSVGVWDAKLITPAIVWFLTTAVVNFLRLPRAMKEIGYFRKLALGAVAAPVVVQFVVDLYPFPLIGEVFLQGGFILLGLLMAVASTKHEYAPAHRLLNVLIGLLALLVVVHSVIEITAQWSKIDFIGELKKFLLPVGMTAAFLPFMYGLTLYAAYELALTHMRVTVPPGTKLMKPAIGLAVRTGFSVRRLSKVTQSTRFDMARASSVEEAIASFDEGLALEAARQQRLADERQRLIDNAGLDGVDEGGKRLDQREFKETKAALDYLHMCHMGHYRNSGRYRDDMVDVLGEDSFVQKGLPRGATITMDVSEDGQQWWAWRRTTPGWVFAVGGKDAPNDRWEYDGPEVPSGGPGQDPAWRHFMMPAGPHEHW